MAAAPPPELRTVAAPREVTAAVSGCFSAAGCDNCVATVEGSRLRLWSAPGNGKPAVERAQEPLPAAICCQQAVRYGGLDMLFVLHAGMHWRLLQLDGTQLRERATGVLEPPTREPEETLFGHETVVCCTVRRPGKPDCVLLAAWDRWLTVLSLESAMPVAHVPLVGAPGLPTSAGLPPRVLRLVTWGGSEQTICNSAADPMGNPAVAVLYADDGLRLLSVQCVNLDLENCVVLPGPWGLQNVGMTEAERSCDLVPLTATRLATDVGPGVLVVGQDVVTYISGDGEQAAQIQISKLPGCPRQATPSPLMQWQCCQVLPLSSAETGQKVLMIGGAAVRSPAACLLHIVVGSRAARLHCGSGGADAVEIEASKVALPAVQEPYRQRRFVALVPGGNPGQVIGCTADGRVIDFSARADGSVAKEMPALTGGWSEERHNCCCAQVIASTCVPLTRKLLAASSEGRRCCSAAPSCETVLAVCGVDVRRGPHAEGGCIALGRLGCARVTTNPAAASFPELPSALHALLLPDGTSLVLCSFSGTTRGTQVFSMREDGAPPVAEPELDQAAPTLSIGFMGRAGIVQVTDEALHLVPALGLGSAAAASMPQRWNPSSAKSLSIGAAAVCEFASLVAVGVGSELICCCPSTSGSDSPFEEVGPRFTCDGGQTAALTFFTPTRGHADGRSVFLGYAEWGSNRVGLLNALTMQPAFESGPIVLQVPSLCRSIAFLEDCTGGNATTIWMLLGLADGQVLCYSTNDWMDATGATKKTGPESHFVLKHTLRVGSSPVKLHCVAQGSEPGETSYVYASSSRDLLLSTGRNGDLQFADVTADDRTLLFVPTNGMGGYGGAAWVTHPQPGGASCAELACGFIDTAERLRWRRRNVEGHTPRHIAFHAPSQTLVVVTEGPATAGSDDAHIPAPGSSLSVHQRQTVRVLDAETLEQLALMELDAGHTVDHLLSELPEGLLPSKLVMGNELMMASSLYRSDSPSGTTDEVQSLLSVLRVTTSREHENARITVQFSLVTQHTLGGGGPNVVTAMCPFHDRHGDPVLAVAHGCSIEVLRLNPEHARASKPDDVESDLANDKAKRKETPIGGGAMNATRVAQVSLGSSGGELGCSLSTAEGYLLYSACSGPATGQSILRWHDDLRLAPQLLIVSRDRVQESGTGLEAQRRAAAVSLLLPCGVTPSRTAGAPYNTWEREEGRDERIGVGRNALAVVAPLAGGLRILRHEASSELSLTDNVVETRSSVPAAGLATASVAETNSPEQEQEQDQEQEPAPEPAAPEPTADDLLVAAELPADGQTQAATSTGAGDDDLVASRPYEMSCWFEQRAEGRSQSLRPVIGIHALPGGQLGVRPLEAKDEVTTGLMAVRDDGTVQVMNY